jgi:integrase
MSGSGASKIDSYDSQVDSYRGEQGRTSAARDGRSGVRGRKRGNDEGTVYQRQDGRWVAAVRDVNGRRVYRYARTRAEAAAKLTLALKATADGIALPSEQQTVAEFLTAWLEESARRTLRPSTFRSYRQIVRDHILPEIGNVRLARLSPQQVQRLINHRLESGLSPQSVLYVRGVLRRALNEALRWGLVARNVAALVQPPRVRRYEITPLDAEQAQRLLTAIRGDRLEALFSVALAVGLRQGEALGLRWDDVDLDTGVLRVRHALQAVDGQLVLVDPKTSRSRRSIQLPSLAVDALREHRIRQSAERARVGEAWSDQGFVFTSQMGRPLHGATVTHRFQQLLATAGLPRQRFHDLRHGCATLLLAQGVSPRVVMDVLGHSAITLTLNTYSHVVPALQTEAARRMDAALGWHDHKPARGSGR